VKAIVVGTDGSETAGRAVRAAGQLSLGAEVRIHVVSAYQPRAVGRVGFVVSSAPEGSWQDKLEKEVETLLQDAAGTLTAMGAKVECHACAGDAAEAILDVAEKEGADLIVVGDRGMRGARRFLLGSVPGKISHHAPCSVMIIRTREASTLD
jgi:nucleotide-binding universal stress UspA family protein